MSHFNYGSKNGMSTLIETVKLLCRIYTKYAAQIIAYVNSSTLDEGKKEVLIFWLNQATTACTILVSMEVVYES